MLTIPVWVGEGPLEADVVAYEVIVEVTADVLSGPFP